jgi:hypothetical protein
MLLHAIATLFKYQNNSFKRSGIEEMVKGIILKTELTPSRQTAPQTATQRDNSQNRAFSKRKIQRNESQRNYSQTRTNSSRQTAPQRTETQRDNFKIGENLPEKLPQRQEIQRETPKTEGIK